MICASYENGVVTLTINGKNDIFSFDGALRDYAGLEVDIPEAPTCVNENEMLDRKIAALKAVKALLHPIDKAWREDEERIRRIMGDKEGGAEQ